MRVLPLYCEPGLHSHTLLVNMRACIEILFYISSHAWIKLSPTVNFSDTIWYTFPPAELSSKNKLLSEVFLQFPHSFFVRILRYQLFPWLLANYVTNTIKPFCYKQFNFSLTPTLADISDLINLLRTYHSR